MPQVEAVRTTFSPDELGEQILRSVRSLPRQGLRLLIAHWAGETGWGRDCWNFNIGNKKATSAQQSYVALNCDENLPRADVLRMHAADPDHVQITLDANGNIPDSATLHAVFLPPHRVTWFRAFDSFAAGVSDYLGMLQRNFPEAWQVVLDGGSAEEYAKWLKQRRYYTASLSRYTRLLNDQLALVDERAPQALAMVEEIARSSVPLS